MAKLYFRYGAMNCGKSTNLIQVAHNYEERGMEVLIAKPKLDTKEGEMIASRLGILRKADFIVAPQDNFLTLIENHIREKGKVDCILTDESQFFTEEQVNQLFEIAVNHNIPVICYGLRTDFMTKGFEGSARLLLIAHSIEELKTICSCGRKAILNARKINGRFVFEGKQVVIDNDAAVQYIAMCGHCYLREKATL
ncbi:MAG: thymidine kinase [Eubacteriales bacterium]|nr:thymidine kinase [Eubacteriales bacterium]